LGFFFGFRSFTLAPLFLELLFLTFADFFMTIGGRVPVSTLP
jgi:hypothetical protein